MPVEERPKRHEKPKIKRTGDEPWTRLIVSAGRAAGLEPADLVHAVTHAAGVDGEAVKDVLVLEQFSFLSVPQSEADRVIDKVGGRAGQRHAPRPGAGPVVTVLLCRPPAGMAS